MKQMMIGALFMSVSSLALAGAADTSATNSTTATTSVPVPSAAQLALAEQYFKSSGMQQLYTDPNRVGQIMNSQLAASEQRMAQTMSPDEAKRFHDFMTRLQPRLTAIVARTLPQMQPELVRILAQTYTEPELKSLVDYYTSPEGKSVAAKNPTLLTAIGAVTGKYTAAMMQDLQSVMIEALQNTTPDAENSPAGK